MKTSLNGEDLRYMKKKHKTELEEFSPIVLDAFNWEDFIRSGELLSEQEEIDDLLTDLE